MNPVFKSCLDLGWHPENNEKPMKTNGFQAKQSKIIEKPMVFKQNIAKSLKNQWFFNNLGFLLGGAGGGTMPRAISGTPQIRTGPHRRGPRDCQIGRLGKQLREPFRTRRSRKWKVVRGCPASPARAYVFQTLHTLFLYVVIQRRVAEVAETELGPRKGSRCP